MAINPGLVRVPGTGAISLAPPGTAEPADATSPLPAAWSDLGLTTVDGTTLSRKVERQATEHWQTLAPARLIITSHEFTVKAAFQESKAAVLSAFFSGLTFVESATGSKKYRGEISSTPALDIRALSIDWADDIYHHRLYVPRVEVTETDDVEIRRTKEKVWGMRFSALAPAGASTVLAVWLTDDPAVVAGAPATLAADEKPAP